MEDEIKLVIPRWIKDPVVVSEKHFEECYRSHIGMRDLDNYLISEIKEILNLAWDVQCGKGWYDIEETEEKLGMYHTKYETGYQSSKERTIK